MNYGEVGLFTLAFMESSFFPIPPDFILIPMCLANPEKALYYAFICTLASALGGGIGYAIGFWGGRPAFNWLFRKGGKEKFDAVEKLYQQHGTWAVFFSAFTPVPYKIFTIGSGILKMNFYDE